MATKIKISSEDLIPSENNSDPMMDQLNKAREEIKKEMEMEKINKENTEEIVEDSDKEKTTKKKSPSSTKKKSPSSKKTNTLTSKQIQEQSEPIPMRNGKVDMSDKRTVVQDMKIQFNDVISNMQIDLNNIVISDSLNTMEKHTNIDIVFNSKPTFEVALAQSCYTAFLESLKYDDIDTIKNSSVDEYHALLQLYQIIHKRIQATTIGKLDFETFCECTSYFDLQSLFYGLHSQTFPGSTKFDFKCIHCQHSFSSEIPNDNLVFCNDEKIFEHLNEVRLNSDNPKKVIENSLLSKHMRICLEQSKTIVDIRVPSLKNQLEILKNTPTEKVDELSEDLAVLLFIKNMYLLNVPETLQKGSPVYYPVLGNTAMINVLKQLSINDSVQLSNSLEEWTDKYKVEYKIPSFNCPNCNEELGEMPVDMENVLFHQMLKL